MELIFTLFKLFDPITLFLFIVNKYWALLEGAKVHELSVTPTPKGS